MSVKSAIFVLWCVGVSLSHPTIHKDKRFIAIQPNQFSNHLHTDHTDEQISKNFDHPYNLEMENSDQFPHYYPLHTDSYSNEPRPSIFGRPSFPDDVELVNSQGKPIQFKPTITDVELFWLAGGKPAPFPKDGEMSEVMLGMGKEQSIPLMVAKDGSQIPVPHAVSMLAAKQGQNGMPIMGQERVLTPDMIQRGGPEMVSMMENEGSHMVPMQMEREGSQMIPMLMERDEAHMIPIQMANEVSSMMPLTMVRGGSHMMPMQMEREDSHMVPLAMVKEGSHMVPMQMEREDSHMVPLAMERDGAHMMPMQMEREDSHMVPLAMVKEGSHMVPMQMEREGSQMMPMSMERDGAHMMPIQMAREESHMVPLTMVREGSQMMPMSMNRDGSHMMPMQVERGDSHMVPLAMVKEGSQMMPMSMELERDGSHMMPMQMKREESYMVPLAMVREESQMIPMSIDKGEPQMMPMAMVRAGPPMMTHDQHTDRSKRQETSSSSNSILGSAQNRNEFEKEFLSMLEKTFMNPEKQNMVLYPIDTREIIIIDNKTTDDEFIKNLFSENKVDQSMTLSMLDSQNEIKDQSFANINKIINDEQKQTSAFEAINEVTREEHKIMNDESAGTSQDTKYHRDEETSTMSISDSIIEITEKERIINEEPSKEPSPVIEDEEDKQNTTMNIFDSINSMNEVKNQQLIETDKIMSGEPSKQSSSEIEDEKDKQSAAVNILEAINSMDEMKNQQLIEKDKIMIEEPAKEIILNYDQDKLPMTLLDSMNEIKRVEVPTNDQPSLDNTSTATEKSITSLFDSKNEVKNQYLTAADDITQKPITIDALVTKIEMDREMAMFEKFINEESATMNKILGYEFIPKRPIYVSTFDSKNDQQKQETTALEDKMSQTISPLETQTQTDKPNYEPIRVTSVPPNLRITGFIQEISYVTDPTLSTNQNQANHMKRKSEEEENQMTETFAPSHPSTQFAKASEYLPLPIILQLALLSSGLNQDSINVGGEIQNSRQSVMAYPRLNHMDNYAGMHAENSQPLYRFVSSNYPAAFYQ